MKLNCEVEINSQLLPSVCKAPRSKASYATLVITQEPKVVGNNKKRNIYLLVCTAQNTAGRKYKIEKNVSRIFKSYANQGKATIRMMKPLHDILIKKADPLQLKAFLQFLSLVLNNDTEKLTFSQPPTKVEKRPKESLIATRENYPKSFPLSLKDVCLSSCTLKRVDSRILRLSNLHTLSLSNNRISALPSSFSNLSLHRLDISNNCIEEFPMELCHGNLVKCLKYLNLGNNSISVIPLEFGYFEQLSHFFICSNNLISLPENFGKVKTLKHFIASNNKLKDMPSSFLHLHYDVLDIANNPFDSEEDLTCPVFKVPSLLECSYLSIKSNRIFYSPEIIPSPLVAYLNENCKECACGRSVIPTSPCVIIKVNVNNHARDICCCHNFNFFIPVKMYCCSFECWKNFVHIRQKKK